MKGINMSCCCTRVDGETVAVVDGDSCTWALDGSGLPVERPGRVFLGKGLY